jgi:hypothetical protein
LVLLLDLHLRKEVCAHCPHHKADDGSKGFQDFQHGLEIVSNNAGNNDDGYQSE